MNNKCQRYYFLLFASISWANHIKIIVCGDRALWLRTFSNSIYRILKEWTYWANSSTTITTYSSNSTVRARTFCFWNLGNRKITYTHRKKAVGCENKREIAQEAAFAFNQTYLVEIKWFEHISFKIDLRVDWRCAYVASKCFACISMLLNWHIVWKTVPLLCSVAFCLLRKRVERFQHNQIHMNSIHFEIYIYICIFAVRRYELNDLP